MPAPFGKPEAFEQQFCAGGRFAPPTVERHVALPAFATVTLATVALVLDAVDGAVAREMASVNQRLFGNSYFRAIDALVLLAAFRLSAMLEWLPWMAAFVAAAMLDGAISRVIKSKEFLHHDPERFALYASVSILLACAAVVALVLPVGVHPLVSPGVVATLAVLWGRSVAHFHRRA